jgi:Tfp pilus assembly protein PilF
MAVKKKTKNEMESIKKEAKQEKGNKLKYAVFIYLIVLIIVTLAAFWAIKRAAFLDMDDHIYVYENETIKKGITFETVKWAFSTLSLGFYFPITILSHLLDVELYGLNSGLHHLTSLLIHIISVCLLFFFLFKGTKNLFNSFLVAGLFGIHPLHVESVSWIAERKDVLSAMFFFLTLLLYLFYVEKPNVKRYLLVLFSFMLGFLSKPMVITLPFVLLLIDFWPLNRFDIFANKNEIKGKIWKPIYEKIPFFILVPIFAYISFIAQKSVQAVVPIEVMPVKLRMLNAFLSYFSYIRKAFLPYDLALFYPFPQKGISESAGLLSFAFVLFITILIYVYGKRRKYLITGWFWYLGVLVPVIGLVQIGGQAMADRYTYISLEGIFILVVWGIYDFVKDKKTLKIVSSVLAFVVLAICFVLTRQQVDLWSDSKKIYEHSIKVTKENYLMHYNLGGLLFREGNIEKAIEHFKEAVAIRENLGDVYLHLGYAYGKIGKIDESIQSLKRALSYLPDSYEGHLNLGKAYETKGDVESAISEYEIAVRLNPKDAVSLTNLGIILGRKGDMNKAVDYFKKAIESKPDYIDAYNSLGVAYLMLKKYDKSIETFKKALEIDPQSQFAKENLSKAENMVKRKQENDGK